MVPQKGYNFLHDIAPCNNSKNTRTFLEHKKNLSWNGHGIIPIEDVWNIMKKDIRNQMPCIMKICGSKYVKCGNV